MWPVALKNGNVVFADPDRVGKSFTCFVCKHRVSGERLADGTFVFLHDPGHSCDAKRAWVRAGMWEVLQGAPGKPGAHLAFPVVQRTGLHGVATQALARIRQARD